MQMNLTIDEVKMLLGEKDLLIHELVKQLHTLSAQVEALKPKPVEPPPLTSVE